MEKTILSGDEAIARGAWEAGVTIAAAYPGTPSTEILENISLYKQDIYCQWANNEKVAAEIAIGGSVGGSRSLAAMKHVGMNVAADPIFTAGYCGVNGGLVIVCADDPGCHSSQNEQDNRLYAPHAKLAMVEPSDSQECKDFTVGAYEISEKFDIPVLIRMTTRVCHSKSVVELSERKNNQVKEYKSNPGKYAMLPAVARRRHVFREDSLRELEEYSYTSPLNKVEWNDKKIGVITSGISYMHAKETFLDSVSYLKIGITNPLSSRLIREFCEQVEKIYIVEEGEPYLENYVRALGFKCMGKDVVTIQGELNAQIVKEAFKVGDKPEIYETELNAPARPPVLCAGCPHRGFFYTLSRYKKKLVGVGDIGCYALGVNAPFNGFDVSVCMGAGFSVPIGLAESLKLQNDTRKVFGMLGDSTFFHTGINSMMDVFHAEANVCLCLLDNSITAMTGHQENAATSKNLMGYEAPPIDILKVIESVGFRDEQVRVVDPLDLKAMDEAVKAALEYTGPFVIVTRRPCILIKEIRKKNAGIHCEIDSEKCVGCKLCMKIACPAMALKDDKAIIADPASCTGCGLCMQMCKFDAISKVGE